MKRAIIAPAAPAPEALAELKQWLAITTPREDESLARLIAAALELCESFTGSLPLECTCEENVAATAAWQLLATRPVQAVVSVAGIGPAGERFALAADAYEIELDGDGGARLRLLRADGARRIAVRVVAGLAPTWRDLPDGLRHGVIRCAAHLHRQRDGAGEALPPAAVTALWRPWRRMRLS